MKFESDGTPKILTRFMANYMQSKVGVAWLAGFFADRLGEKGVLSVCVHPGLMVTELQRHQRWFFRSVIRPLLVSSVFLYALMLAEHKIWLLNHRIDTNLQAHN